MEGRILIIGGSSFLGGHLVKMSVRHWDTFASYYSTPINMNLPVKSIMLDIRNKKNVDKVVTEVLPKIVINTAAISDVNFCERFGEVAWEVNFNGAKNIVEAAGKIGAKLIHISTDLVFDGQKGNYTEDDTPSPLSNYGKSKLAADNFIQSFYSNFCIIRSSLIYGLTINTAESFIERIIQTVKAKEIYNGFVDEFRNPIFVTNLCDIIIKAGEKADICGLYHVCGPTKISRYDFALKICDIIGLKNDFVVPTKVANYSFSQLRPKDCSMINNKIQSLLKDKILDVEEGLYKIKQSISHSCV
ncbi:MAG: SDR family oxidoreductase [Bacteroidales bacterium]|nr:SDR family oxidoreductase [Bacteroidales bacterium]